MECFSYCLPGTCLSIFERPRVRDGINNVSSNFLRTQSSPCLSFTTQQCLGCVKGTGGCLRPCGWSHDTWSLQQKFWLKKHTIMLLTSHFKVTFVLQTVGRPIRCSSCFLWLCFCLSASLIVSFFVVLECSPTLQNEKMKTEKHRIHICEVVQGKWKKKLLGERLESHLNLSQKEVSSSSSYFLRQMVRKQFFNCQRKCFHVAQSHALAL